jgi:hypothetical protein
MPNEIAATARRSGRRPSYPGLLATPRVTDGAEHETGGHVKVANQPAHAPARRPSSDRLTANVAMTDGAQIGDQHQDENHAGVAPAGEGHSAPARQYASALSDTCERLKALQRKRRFCIVSQSRCDRSCEALLASVIGYSPDMDAKARKEIWKQASAARKAIEDGEDGHTSSDNHTRSAILAVADIVRQSAQARASWDTLRREVERDMRKIAKSLHVYPWAQGVAGFGDLGLGIIIGETGDLHLYATKERVWKRLGLAVIEGFRQQRKSGVEEAAAHGYNPKRRAEVWAIADSMFRHQWRGAKDDAPAHALGPYGEAYARRKAHTETREWTPKHRDNDARRIMAKQLVEDLWREWRRDA